MASPEIYETLNSFIHHIPPYENMFLPLMQSNDVFIMSALMKGLIDHVVWIKPTWLNESRSTMLMKAYIGVTLKKNSNVETVCQCQQQIIKSRRLKTPLQCSYLDRDNAKVDASPDNANVVVSASDCRKIHPFTFITVSEKKFSKLVDLKKVKNLFLDIDEDYFGVESGVQSLINTGISLKTLTLVDEYLMSLYCPQSTKEEETLNAQIQNLFRFVHELMKNNNAKNVKTITKYIFDSTSICKFGDQPNKVVTEFSDDIVSFSIKEVGALAKAKYCLILSPQLRNDEVTFTLCHGNIYPGDPLNQIYVGAKDEVKQRGENLVDILNLICNYTQPRFYTIARSLRDGYTPRNQQRYIEKIVLESLDKVISRQGKQKRLIYDSELVFGKEGWV